MKWMQLQTDAEHCGNMIRCGIINITAFTQCSKSGTWHLSCLLYFSLLPVWCRGFLLETMLQENYTCSPRRSFLRQQKSKPCGSNFKMCAKTSAPDCPSFDSLSLFTCGEYDPCCYSPLNHEPRWLKTCLSSVMISACLDTTQTELYRK